MSEVLLIEDDVHLAGSLQHHLAFGGHGVSVVAEPGEGLERIRSDPPDLVVLDLMVGGGAGPRLLETLLERQVSSSLVVLTDRYQDTGSLVDLRERAGHGEGMSPGVACLRRPFTVEELLGLVVRCLNEREASPRFTLGLLRIDLERYVIEAGDTVDYLTPTEVALLQALRSKRGGPVSRAELLRRVWNLPAGSSRTLDAHVSRLRKKLEPEPSRPCYLRTVRGIGYRLAEDLVQEQA